MSSRILYHISNGIALAILTGYSLNLIVGWAELHSINLLYILIPVILVNYGLRVWAKKLDPEVINPIVESKLARIMYYGGAILFIAAIVAHFMHISFLQTPLLLLAVLLEIVAWVLSLAFHKTDKNVNSEIFDDIEL